MPAEKSSKNNLTYVQKLLLDLRNSYISDLPVQFDELEQMVFSLKEPDNFVANFQELFRKVHSMKGSAGTHGLNIVTRVCHQFEDQLHIVDGTPARLSDTLFENWLKFVDLLRATLELVNTNDNKFTNIENELDSLRSSIYTGEYSVLIVEDSKSTGKLCYQALEDMPLRISVIDDGFQALELLLNSQFDLLISSMEVKTLNGIGLIAAIKMSSSPSKDLKTILLTSKDEISTSDLIKPDYILRKDVNLIQNLHEIATSTLYMI
jgi:CheY-like chemotaxis protein